MRKVLNIFRWFARRGAAEHRMESEIRFHIDRETDLLTRTGMTAEEARRRALLRFGGVEPVRENMRDARSGRMVETFLQDVRYGARVLLRNPAFTVAAILILALGIGANTAMFSIVYGVLLRPLPYQQGGQLVVLHQRAAKAGRPDIPFSVKEIEDYRGSNSTLSSVVEHHSMSFLLLDDRSAERVNTAVVSANFFNVLGLKPLHGRTFVADDEKAGAPAVLILSHKYWQTRHGGDKQIVGRVFQMNNRPHLVIGVLPPVPQFPVENDVYMPTSQCPTRSSDAFRQNRQARMMTAFGRLKPGVPLGQAQADLSVVASSLRRSYPETYPEQAGYSVAAVKLDEDLTRRGKGTFLILLGAAALVLLIACANVANLLLARLLRTEREMAVRAALGASRIRLVRQLITESVLLSTAGAVLGLAMVPAAMKLLVQFAERFTTRATEVRIDTPVLLFTLGLSVATGLIFGIAPALSLARDVASAIRATGTRTTSSRGRQRVRGLLVSAQVAISFTLLIGAGLMTRTLFQMLKQDAGFRADRLLTLRITPNFSRYTQPVQYQSLMDRVLTHTAASAGVESVALATNFPFNPRGIANGPGNTSFEIEGRPLSQGELAPRVDIANVSEAYFDTILQPLLNGRPFNGHDEGGKERVGIINQTMARVRWPNEDPIGRRISFDGRKTWVRIVGVVGDARKYGLSRPTGDEIYLPVRQSGFAGNLMVRTSREPSGLEGSVRAALREVDPFLAVDEVSSIERLRDESVAAPRLTAALLGLFGLLALLISAGGIGAVMALSVSQRTHEMGIRLALGAKGGSLVRTMVRQGIVLTTVGIAAGIIASVGLTRLMSTLLYGVSPTDPITYAAICGIFLLVAAVASYVPARRITAIDPLHALRQE
jgi:putative ABC transport system permease protein